MRTPEVHADTSAVGMPNFQVLNVGAGPAGLVLAIWLTRLGVRVRIVDKAAEPGTTSRAIVVHARTLEFYRQLGLADEVVRQGQEFVAGNLWGKGPHAGRIEFGPLGRGLSPFPYMLVYPQDEHERLLIERLAEAGIRVDHCTTLTGLDARGITCGRACVVRTAPRRTARPIT